MKNKHCFYTSFNKAYAGQALLLAESLRRVYGDNVDIIAVLVDELDENEVIYFNVFDSILLAAELEIPNFKAWIFGLNIIEAATAVKPFALCELLKKYAQVTYLDPDIIVYSTLDEITEPDHQWSLSLTPHQTIAQSTKWLVEANELESLKFGVYNLGFLSVRATPEGKKVAEWWRDRCYDYCIIDVAKGIFTDQKFFDIAPALFTGLNILRHPGYNVATWNLKERFIKLENNKLLSNNELLRFCHFTKATHAGASAMERVLENNNMYEELFYSYLSKLNSKNIDMLGLNTKWSYGFYSDGEAIKDEARKCFRQLGGARWDVVDPFVVKL